MTKPAGCWLAALLAAAIAAFAPLRVAAEEPGPNKAANPETAQPPETIPPAKGAKRDTYPFRGVVASFDPNAQALTLEGKASRRVVHLTEQTRLIKQGQPAVADDLRPGEQVSGTLRKKTEGREEAVMIRIGPKSDDPGTGAGKKPESGTKEKEKEAAE